MRRGPLSELMQARVISTEQTQEAVDLSGVRPSHKAWWQFADYALTVLGGLALACSVMFFVAYNWDDIGKFSQFALVEGLIVAAVIGYWKFGHETLAGKVALLVGGVLVGVLLALYSQTYQTGADPWQLFFYWGLLVLPWLAISRFAVMWVLWIGLLNITLATYFTPRFFLVDEHSLTWSIFALNTFFLFSAEVVAPRVSWLATRWPHRLLAMASGVPITQLAMVAVMDQESSEPVALLVWLAGLIVLYVVYHNKIRDLFLLAGGCLSIIVVIVTWLAWLLMDGLDEGALLIIGGAIVAMGGAAAWWLRRVREGWDI